MTKYKNETDIFREAQYEDRDLEELQADAAAATPTKMGLPTTWADREGGVEMPGPHTIVQPSASDVRAYGEDGGRATCGSCRHFDLKGGRQKIVEERFAERLVREQEWQLKHLAVPPDMLGMCGMTDDTATTVISKSCEQYAPKLTRAGRWRL